MTTSFPVNVWLVDPVTGEPIRRVLYEMRQEIKFAEFTVPEGFVTDFGSVPSALEWIVSGEDAQLVLAAVGHDYLYRNNGLGQFTRKQADEWMAEQMRKAGASWTKRNVALAGVRLGGWLTWWRAARTARPS